MKRRLSIRDPIAAHQRDAIARRRVGENAQCACGESRPNALITGSNPLICGSCGRLKDGKVIFDDHHVVGQANSPVTIPVWVNDHWAVLNSAQHDWPKTTLENREGSPLLAAAAANRGTADTIIYLVETFLYEKAEMLEDLDVFLEGRLGPEWWVGTPLEKYKPNHMLQSPPLRVPFRSRSAFIRNAPTKNKKVVRKSRGVVRKRCLSSTPKPESTQPNA